MSCVWPRLGSERGFPHDTTKQHPSREPCCSCVGAALPSGRQPIRNRAARSGRLQFHNGGPDMDRRQMVVQRVREYFAERLDDVLHMVRDDRQVMRGWQEPAHVRAAVRRTEGAEGGAHTTTTEATLAEDSVTDVSQVLFEFGRGAGEPEGGQQREAIGQLLESGSRGLEKLTRNTSDLTSEEAFGLEAVLLLYARPALLVSQGRLASVSPFWNLIE